MKDPFYAPQTPFEPLLVESASLGSLELLIRGQAAQYLHGWSESTIDTVLTRLADLFDDWVTGDLAPSPLEKPMRATTFNLIRVGDERGNPVDGPEADERYPMSFFSPALELFYRCDEADVVERFADLHLHWPGLLAILALGYLGAAGKARDSAYEAPTVQAAMTYADRASALTAHAMEAIALADRSLGEDGFVRRQVRARTQERSAAAGRARHAKTDALKTRLHLLYSSREWPSKAECARRFLACLPESDAKLLSSSNAIRTLTDWLKD